MTDFEATVARILASGKITRDELMRRIGAKLRELTVTPEGAAGMVAKELGVKVDG